MPCLKKNNLKKIKIFLQLLFKIKQQIITKDRNSFVNICIKILNHKLYNIGVLKLAQCFLSQSITEKSVLQRSLLNILTKKLNSLNNGNILKLIKKKRVVLNNKEITTPNILLGIISENDLDIKI